MGIQGVADGALWVALDVVFFDCLSGILRTVESQEGTAIAIQIRQRLF